MLGKPLVHAKPRRLRSFHFQLVPLYFEIATNTLLSAHLSRVIPPPTCWASAEAPIGARGETEEAQHLAL